METLLAALADILQTILHALVSVESFPLVIAGIFLLAVTFVGGYAITRARVSALQHVSDLVESLHVVTDKLAQAEKIGHFGSFVWDFQNSKSSFWSQEMYQLFGMVERERPPRIEELYDIIFEKDRAEAKAAWVSAQTKSGDFNFSFRVAPRNGPVRYLNVRGKTTIGSGQELQTIQGAVHDITKEMEIDRAKSEFVSLASHQLKTPLTSIRWLGEALLSGSIGELAPEQKNYVRNIIESEQRMMEMVNELLNTSRIELNTLATHLEEFGACEFLHFVAAEQKHTAEEKKVNLLLKCAPDLPPFFADKNLLRMVLQNLISNAIKYTPTNGSVECEMTIGGTNGEAIFLRVSDTGIGIPMSEQDKIFDKLFRASNAQATVPDGTGLGLYVVKMIIDRTGGGISFDSTEGKGTTFYATIPARWPGIGPESGGKDLAK